MPAHFTATDIAQQLAQKVEPLCRELLPGGRRDGHEWRCGSVQGEAGVSLGVHLTGEKAGVWSDFATGESGDALDLVAAVKFDGDKGAAIKWARPWLGVENDRPSRPKTNGKRSTLNGANRAKTLVPPSQVALPDPIKHPQFGEPSLVHEYHDADGRLIFVHCRFTLDDGGKTFRPLSFIDGRWCWKDPAGALPLYGLADLAAHTNKPVLLVEGERTAEVARETHDEFVVTTWPHGAKAVARVDWSPVAGRTVTCWPDADEPGRKGMKSAAERIARAGGAARIVQVPRNLPNGWDLADELPEGWDERTIDELIREAPDYVNPSIERPRPNISQMEVALWEGREPDPLVFTVRDLIPQGMITLFTADGGAGKSLLAQSAMTCIALGQPFLGLETLSGAAAGIFAEDPGNVLHIRQRRINERFGVSMVDLEGRLFPQSYLGFDAVLWRDDRPTEFLFELEAQLARIVDLRFVVIDNVALVFSGNENDRTEVTRFMAHLTAFAHRLKVGLLLTSHTSKSSDGSKSRMSSGSTAWVWSARSALTLRPDKETKVPVLSLFKANHAPCPKDIALVWRDGVLTAKPQPDNLDRRIRSKHLDQYLFEEIQRAWDADYPLSPTVQTGHRYLPKALSRQSDYSARELKDAIELHMRAGNIKVGQKKSRSLRGLCVVNNLFCGIRE